MASNLAIPEALSATGVTFIAIIVMRGNYIADIRYFLLNQRNLDSQKKNIELTIEFTDRIKSFIPKKIASRMEKFLQQPDASVVNAIYEVLRPRKQHIACLFSDIRGFTESSKNLEKFVGDAVLPNVKACTESIEINGGIPRKIGDLVFAYFDEENESLNLLRAIHSGLDIARLQEREPINTSGTEVNRYILISIGEAIVGNIGGFDSSVEITALGSPVNFLARLDEATKHPELASLIAPSDLLICDRTLSLLKRNGVDPEVHSIDLSELGVMIRNFPEERFVHSMRPSEYNRRIIVAAHSKLERIEAPTWNDDRSQAA